MGFEIYLHDLKEDIQKQVLEFYGDSIVEHTEFEDSPLFVLTNENDADQ